jgi:hypothetical protein
LLRGSWQSVNLGDIAHTPGALQLFARYWPDADVTLWPGSLDFGAREMLVAAFPRLEIAVGGVDRTGRPTTEALARAWASSDLFVHGSGAGFGARRHLEAWHAATRRPYGLFGITMDPVSGIGEGRLSAGDTLAGLKVRISQVSAPSLNPQEHATFDGAAFIFCRDRLSLGYLAREGVKARVLAFGPDSTFGLQIRNEPVATRFLQAHGLEEGKFICVVPRMRYTPYSLVYKIPRTATDDIRDAVNGPSTKPDHAKLRDMMVRWVRATGLKVLACPEMTHEVQLAKEELVDPLPDEVKDRVVWRDSYWLPDEAASVYARACAVVSMECHSPIIALAQGTPALYVRQPTDSAKGQMYEEIGLGDWALEIEENSGESLWAKLSSIHYDPVAARERVKRAMTGVAKQQRFMVETARDSLT